ncbi:MAG: cyclopropane-fatty-acyl-phospholipid synthase [Planktomarina sp.]|jgi:cyclopropane-fatty-acyl-phospholipid synthase|tara:strand:- start:246 stop:1454 length:1209 start_codon:yes stop_codon:yes gene_type:complete
MILTTTDGQKDLPRYFATAFGIAQKGQNGRIDFVLDDGRTFRAEGPGVGPICEIRIHNSGIFERLLREGQLGFCDAYLDGQWSTPNLQAFMDYIHADNDEVFDSFPGQKLVQLYERFRFRMQGNSKGQARKNISYHYDLGNDFYGLWLDKTMTYSSAIFADGQESLEKAQTAKYASMVDQMGVKAGDHVLEIGCGWGGFAEYAAKERGLNVTCLTISKEQIKYSQDRITAAGLQDLVTFKLQDYRDETGVYDGIASIEMFEAVGEKYWPSYFKTIHDRLKPGAQATLQIITVRNDRFDVYRKSVDFIQKYIFPGGMLPSPAVLAQQVEKAGLNVVKSIEFGESYSQTLRRWHDTFNDKWDQVVAMGFDDRFRRMWNFYLTSCAATFHYGNCDVTQITISKPN